MHHLLAVVATCLVAVALHAYALTQDEHLIDHPPSCTAPSACQGP
jgi:hypothetical protein